MTIRTTSEADMADSSEDDVDEGATVEEESTAKETHDKVDKVAEKPEPVDEGHKPASSRRNPWQWVAAVLLIVLVGVGVFGYLQYKNAADQLSAMRQEEANRAAAAQLAKDYALKSLTYSFKDPDAFFRSVEEGVSDALKDKYINAEDLLKGVMLQAQVTSTGEVLATEVTPQPGDVYQVVVSASQTTRNLQNPEPRVSIVLLQITVNKAGDTWQVSDIGPKTGSKAANADQVLPSQPGPPAEPGPSPGRPTPPR